MTPTRLTNYSFITHSLALKTIQMPDSRPNWRHADRSSRFTAFTTQRQLDARAATVWSVRVHKVVTGDPSQHRFTDGHANGHGKWREIQYPVECFGVTKNVTPALDWLSVCAVKRPYRSASCPFRFCEQDISCNYTMKLWTSVLILELPLPLFASVKNFGKETIIWFDAQATNFTRTTPLGNLDNAAKKSHTALRNPQRYASNTMVELKLDSAAANIPALVVSSLRVRASE